MLGEARQAKAVRAAVVQAFEVHGMPNDYGGGAVPTMRLALMRRSVARIERIYVVDGLALRQADQSTGPGERPHLLAILEEGDLAWAGVYAR